MGAGGWELGMGVRNGVGGGSWWWELGLGGAEHAISISTYQIIAVSVCRKRHSVPLGLLSPQDLGGIGPPLATRQVRDLFSGCGVLASCCGT